MLDVWRKHWVAVLIIWIAVLALASWVNLGRDVGRPFGGFLTYYAPLADSRNVDRRTPSWWPAITAGITYGDSLVKVAGKPYGVDQGRVYADVYARQASTIQLTVNRGGEEMSLHIPLAIFTFANYLDIRLPDFLNGLGFWLLAFIVYRARPTELLNRVFALACSLEAATVWLGTPSLFLHTGFLSKTLDFVLFALVFPLAPAAIVHLALLYLRPSRFYHPVVLYLLYGVAALIMFSYGLSRLLLWHSGQSPLVGQLDSFAFYGSWYIRVAGILIFVTRLLWALFDRNASTRQQSQARMTLLGFGVAAFYIVPVAGLTLFGGSHALFWNNLDLRYLFLAIPAFVAVAILRYQVFSRARTSFFIVPIIAFSSLVASAGAAAWRTTADSNLWTPFVIALGMTLAASLVWATQVRWQGFFGRLLHWERRSYDAVRVFGQRLIGHTDLASLPAQISTTLVSELELERAAVWLWREENKAFELMGQAGQWPQPLFEQLPASVDRLQRVNRPLRLKQSDSAVPGWLMPLSSSVEVAVPLLVAGKVVGLIALGKRWDEEVFDERDLEIVELVGQQAALLLLTALQIDKLRRVPRLVDEAQERERAKIAQELHDTVQQFLGRLPFFLEISRHVVWSDPQQTEQILQQCINDVEEAARTVRQIRNNLTANRLENGLVQPLINLVERFQMRTGIDIDLQIMDELDLVLSLGARHALYRVVQQALDNIAEHAEADQALISLIYQDGKVAFRIVDNGRGSSETERIQAQVRGSFGLKSMAARVRNLNGDFTFNSLPRAGTQVSGWVPVDS